MKNMRFKKIICGGLAALAIGAAALAEMPEAIYPEGALPFGIDEQIPIDLDGNGAEESMVLRLEGVELEENLGLYVFGSDGDVYSYKIPISVFEMAYAQDVDGDGAMEIFLCGDMCSDDYATWCLHYTPDVGLNPVPFAAMTRGYLAEAEQMDYGYGMITAASGASITLTGSQDVLGTWMMSRSFTLQNGAFQLEDGLWKIPNPDWEYTILKTARDLPAIFEDGAGTIPTGEEILILESDLQSMVHFEMQDGRSGRLEIAFNAENGWGFSIDGMPEEECFEWIPYAD